LFPDSDRVGLDARQIFKVLYGERVHILT
jgi:hypothetical protein